MPSTNFGAWSRALGEGKSEVGYGNVEVVEGMWAARRPRK